MKILFINSKGHWGNSWLTSREELQMATGVLRKAGMEMVKQCLTCFPGYTPMQVFEGLVYTVACQALLQYEAEAPDVIRKRNLFTMNSDIVVRCSIVNSAVSKQKKISHVLD